MPGGGLDPQQIDEGRTHRLGACALDRGQCLLATRRRHEYVEHRDIRLVGARDDDIARRKLRERRERIGVYRKCALEYAFSRCANDGELGDVGRDIAKR
jgi:hypothetical protein